GPGRRHDAAAWPDPSEGCPSGHSIRRSPNGTLCGVTQTTTTETPATGPGAGTRRARPRIHRAWFVAAVTFVTIIGAAAFRAVPGLFTDPLHTEFGWSRGTIGAAVSIN